MTRSRTFRPADGPFTATVTVPGDKSLGHRGLILAAIAEGASRISGISDGLDNAATSTVLRSLGVDHTGDHVYSPGRAHWSRPPRALDCANSGTTMRLMAGALASGPVAAVLIGDESLSRRPMGRLLEPLRALGAEITVAEGGTPPVHVTGRSLQGRDVWVPQASAQVRTAVALAALDATGATTIDSPPGFRDHTERWLTDLGRGSYESNTRFRVEPGPIPPLVMEIPGDPSSAAFLWAAAAVVPGSTVTTPRVSANSGRLGFLDVLEAMGAEVQIEPEPDVLGDPTGTITVRAKPLTGIEITGALTVRALDELPLVAVVAAAASGPTVVADAHELRHKESDRIDAAARLARLAGAGAETRADGFVVTPGRTGADTPDTIDAGSDHRVAMAAAVAALAAPKPVTVTGYEAAAVSWPRFADALEALWS